MGVTQLTFGSFTPIQPSPVKGEGEKLVIVSEVLLPHSHFIATFPPLVKNLTAAWAVRHLDNYPRPTKGIAFPSVRSK